MKEPNPVVHMDTKAIKGGAKWESEWERRKTGNKLVDKDFKLNLDLPLKRLVDKEVILNFSFSDCRWVNFASVDVGWWGEMIHQCRSCLSNYLPMRTAGVFPAQRRPSESFQVMWWAFARLQWPTGLAWRGWERPLFGIRTKRSYLLNPDV